MLILAAASTAAVALLVLPDCTSHADARSEHRDRASMEESVRVKGLRPHLVIHRKRGDAVERMSAGQMAQSGDMLQISYVAAGHQHGVVVSVDGAGGVTLHHPLRPNGSTELHARGETPLTTAFELDDAPHFERFILVASGDTPTDIDLVMSSARALASGHATTDPLDLPDAYAQSTIVIRKTR